MVDDVETEKREMQKRTVLSMLGANDVSQFKLCQLIVGPINYVGYIKFQQNLERVLLAKLLRNLDR